MRISFVIAFLIPVVLAHGEEASVWTQAGVPDPVSIVAYATGISGFFILYALVMQKSMSEGQKKLVFALIALPIMVATVFLVGSTILVNSMSITGGPVHWHADYEVWACGQKHELVDPASEWDNKVGTPLLHEHNDNRIHLEGVLFDTHQATIGEFFEVTGGGITETSLTFATNDGTLTWKNGDDCGGSPAAWHMFVNERLVEFSPDHVIAPYSNVPPGDVIKLVFTDKLASQINPRLFEVP